MAKTKILQAAIIVLTVTLFAGCSPGRAYHSYPPPPPRPSVSLIIDAGPGLAVHRFHDGRFYYRAPNGYIYWRGYNNRFYLDRKYVAPYHHHRQYDQWKRYHSRRR